MCDKDTLAGGKSLLARLSVRSGAIANDRVIRNTRTQKQKTNENIQVILDNDLSPFKLLWTAVK